MAAVVGPKSSTRTTRGSSTGRAPSKIKTNGSKSGSPRGSPRGANPSIVQSGKHIVGNYLLQKKLGVGTFGEVRLAIHIPTGK
jgi:serine/threonine protein kinase